MRFITFLVVLVHKFYILVVISLIGKNTHPPFPHITQLSLSKLNHPLPYRWVIWHLKKGIVFTYFAKTILKLDRAQLGTGIVFRKCASLYVACSYAHDSIRNACHISFFKFFFLIRYNSISHMQPGFKGNLSILDSFCVIYMGNR